MLRQVEEWMWMPPVLISHEEEGCEECRVGKHLFPCKEQPLAHPCSAKHMEAGPDLDSDMLAPHLGARALRRGQATQAQLDLGVCDCECKRVRMET